MFFQLVIGLGSGWTRTGIGELYSPNDPLLLKIADPFFPRLETADPLLPQAQERDRAGDRIGIGELYSPKN